MITKEQLNDYATLGVLLAGTQDDASDAIVALCVEVQHLQQERDDLRRQLDAARDSAAIMALPEVNNWSDVSENDTPLTDDWRYA